MSDLVVMGERPLPPSARFALVAAAAMTILLFYVAAILSMALLAVINGILLIGTLFAARFGLGGFVGRQMVPTFALFTIIARRLWLSSREVAYRIPIEQADAPRLFAVSRELALRLDVPPPDTIVLEMHGSAWVRLHGFRRASGRATLCVGLDLLAGMSVDEVEAVIAHELGHARFVQRGLQQWLGKGLARLSAVTGHVAALHARAQSEDTPSDLARWANTIFTALTIRAARLIATYSRQDEFDADRAAADVCGAAAFRSALLSLEPLARAGRRLAWSERLARLRAGDDFSGWLVAELARLVEAGRSEPVAQAEDPFSTHPSIRDRIDALPTGDGPTRRAEVGIGLLADPDDVTRRLVAEIERIQALEERRDSRVLAKATRRFSRAPHKRFMRGLGVVTAGFGMAMGLSLILDGMQIDGLIVALALVGLGVALTRYKDHHDRLSLPVPPYGSLEPPPVSFKTAEEAVAAERALTAEIGAEADKIRGKRPTVKYLTSVAYEALARPDYFRAYVAARLALTIDEKSVEPNLAHAVAVAAIGDTKLARATLDRVRARVGLSTVSTKWGAAWAMLNTGDWSCEGLLQQLHQREPKVATFAALLALTQLAGEKLHSALQTVDRAIALDPGNQAIQATKLEILVQAGRAREAGECAAPLEDYARTRKKVAFSMVRLHLLRRDTAAATAWARVLLSLDDTGEPLLLLGRAFALYRIDDVAQEFFNAALETKYTPQAHLELAALAALGGDREKARTHLRRALKMRNKSVAFERTVASLFQEIVSRLRALDDQKLGCRAWIAAIPHHSGVLLSGASLLVCAPSEDAARRSLMELLIAMEEPGTRFDAAKVRWRPAPKEQQPLRPVSPGVHALLNDQGHVAL